MSDNNKLTTLLIDDDEGDAELLFRQLEDMPGGREIEFLPFTDAKSGVEALKTRDVDLIFIDYLLGAETGLDALRAIRAAGIPRPIIMLTGQGNETVAVEAMKSGAADYLIKGRISIEDLHRAITNVLEKDTLLRKIEEQRKELEWLAKHDGLTGLFNRRFFMEALADKVNRATAGGSPMCLLVMDLDHFKKVNDTYGHLSGDEALINSAKVIKESLRDGDSAGRFGGEEFCIALQGLPIAGAREFAETLRERLASQTYRSADGKEFRVTSSIGLAELNPGSRELTPLIRAADEALYRAKEGGRNRVCS